MGFRFRKSINLGGGFKINLSKSGVGYSFGGQGFRVTKKAKGGMRTTASIPGTGISYTKDYGSGKRRASSSNTPAKHTPTQVPAVRDNTYDTQEIRNANAKLLVSEGLEEMLAAANESLKIYTWAAIGFWVSLFLGCGFPLLWVASVACFIYGLRVKKHGTINLDYTFEDDQAALVAERMNPLVNMVKSKKLWYISQTSKVADRKYSAGANSTIKRNDCKAKVGVPFPFKTTATAVTFKLGKETLAFLPDKLFVIQGTTIGALNYSDVETRVHGQRFIETQAVPKDAKIVDYTWQYVNKSGGPDKRFQNNKKIPVCLYGEMEVRSESGLNTDIMFSNINIQ